MQVVSIDCGRRAVKAFNGQRALSIPAVVGEWRERNVSEGGNYSISINNEKYFVGDLAANESRFRREMVTQSKIHEETKILTLSALALMAVPGERIKLVTGLPVEQHTPDIKQEYIRLLSGRYDVEVNGTRSTIALGEDDIGITIEGGGAYWANNPGRMCRVIDLGSRTINALTIKNGKFIDVDSFTLNYGCIEIENAGTDAAAEQLARRVYADLSRRWLNVKSEKILLAGGGALAMGNWMQEYYPTARIVEDPINANARGNYWLGCQRWGK